MKRQLSLMLVLFIIIFVSCTSAIDSESQSEQLEQQIQNESLQFEDLMMSMDTLVGSMKYPGDISISSIIPDGWLFETLESAVGDSHSSTAYSASQAYSCRHWVLLAECSYEYPIRCSK